MAATKRNRTGEDEVRQKIRTTQLLNRLQNNGLGKLKNPLSFGEIRSIEILLNKVIPNLTSVDQKGGVTINHIMRLPAPQSDLNEWQRVHGDPLKALPKPTTVQ